MAKNSKLALRLRKVVFFLAVFIIASSLISFLLDLNTTATTPGAGPSWIQKYQDHVGSETDTSPPAWGMWWRYLTLLIFPGALVAGVALLFFGVVWDMYFGPAAKRFEEKQKKVKK